MQVTITIDEQTLSKVLQAFTQFLQPGGAKPGPETTQPKQLARLQNANAVLRNTVQTPQQELAALKAQLIEPTEARPADQAQSNPAKDGPGSQAAQPAQAPSNGPAVQTIQAHCKSLADKAPSQAKSASVPQRGSSDQAPKPNRP